MALINRMRLRADGYIEVYSRFDDRFISLVKGIDNTRWDRNLRAWLVPMFGLEDMLTWDILNDKERDAIKMMIDKILSTDIDINVPALNNGFKYYPYQVEALKFISKLPNSILSLDMGLGKTLISQAHAYNLLNSDKVDKVLIYCPATLKWNWAGEIDKFFGNRMSYVVIDGHFNKRKELWNEDTDIYITNYDLLIRNDYEVMEMITKDYKVLIIADEVTRIKNWKAKRTVNMKKLRPFYRLGLTGLPLENHLSELYNIVDWLGMSRSMFGYYSQFRQKYMITDEYGNVVEYINLSDINRKIKYVMYRKKKEDVLPDLPGKIINNYYIELTESELADYHFIEDMLNSVLAKIDEFGIKKVYNEVLAWMTLSRMFCDYPELIRMSDSESANKIKPYVRTTKHTKLSELMNLLNNELEDRKVVIFTQFSRMADVIYDMIKDRHVYLLSGKVKNRQDVIDTFNNDDSNAIFISTDAGAYGVNLQSASYMINYDLPFNPAVLEQRIARLHRIGQKEVVNVVNMIVKHEELVEKRVEEILGNKYKMIQEVIE